MDVERRSGLSRDVLRREYVHPQRPVILTDYGASWPARTRWTFDELRRRGAGISVVVEEGNVVQGDRPRLRMTLGDYLDLLDSGEAAARQLYLGGFDIFRHFPDTRADVDFSVFGRKPIHYRRAWIGAAGTGSGYHRDVGNNILTQVVGDKLVRLVAPADNAYMYKSSRYELLTDASEIDADNWDAARHPDYAKADVAEFVLHPGEGVFLPAYWWHYTKALSSSISVNSGGVTLWEAAKEWRHFGKHLLHVLHLYRWGDCACHPKIVDAGVSSSSA